MAAVVEGACDEGAIDEHEQAILEAGAVRRGLRGARRRRDRVCGACGLRDPFDECGLELSLLEVSAEHWLHVGPEVAPVAATVGSDEAMGFDAYEAAANHQADSLMAAAAPVGDYYGGLSDEVMSAHFDGVSAAVSLVCCVLVSSARNIK